MSWWSNYTNIRSNGMECLRAPHESNGKMQSFVTVSERARQNQVFYCRASFNIWFIHAVLFVWFEGSTHCTFDRVKVHFLLMMLLLLRFVFFFFWSLAYCIIWRTLIWNICSSMRSLQTTSKWARNVKFFAGCHCSRRTKIKKIQRNALSFSLSTCLFGSWFSALAHKPDYTLKL